MNLEDLVPPLELCKLIPAGEFEDSAFLCEAEVGMASRKNTQYPHYSTPKNNEQSVY